MSTYAAFPRVARRRGLHPEARVRARGKKNAFVVVSELTRLYPPHLRMQYLLGPNVQAEDYNDAIFPKDLADW